MTWKEFLREVVFRKEVWVGTLIGILMLVLPPIGVLLALKNDRGEFDGFS